MTAMTTFPDHRQLYRKDMYVGGCKAGVSAPIKDKRKRKNERDREGRKKERARERERTL